MSQNSLIDLSPPGPLVDRRRVERFPAADNWSAEIVLQEGSIVLAATLLDTAVDGVGLRLEAGLALENLGVGGFMVLSIRSAEQTFTRQACIRWVKTQGEALHCGAHFQKHAIYEPGAHHLRLAEVRVDPSCALKIPAATALRRSVLPFAQLDGVVHVACEDSENGLTVELVERLLNAPAQFWEVDPDELKQVLRRVYGEGRGAVTGGTPAAQQDTTGVGDDLLYAAYLRQASDIHIDPGPKSVVVRFRVDGKLELHNELPLGLQSELVSRFKVMSGMDIAEKRAPQDGRFTFQVPGQSQKVDIRAATLPTKYGERLALRLLALETDILTLERLGLKPVQKHAIESFLRRSQGMMVLTGPTGSGKTTSLYASIRMLLAERALNVMTIEDPIEYAIDGVAQCEVDSADKVSFAKALRSILRHDPDVVMIGEIRDGETAEIAMKAALTGHLVLATMHTNSSAATVSRLLDIGIEPYLVGGTLRLAISQRLSRRLCRHCLIPRALTETEALSLNRPNLAGRTVYESCGCIYCAGRGYAGRIGLYELLEMNVAWAREIAEGAGESRMVENMRVAGTRFLEDDAIEKLFAGDISFSDALQIVNSW